MSDSENFNNSREGGENGSQPEPNPEDIMKILVATDIHLGYGEKDPIISDDSFITFEEILEHAVANEVDLVLLGGDLFHDARPTPNSYYRCIKLLRTYALGDKNIEVEFLSDQTVNFAESLTQTVNYEDPNLNVSMPIYSIHGNHDDISGFGRLSSMDILSSTGLINYFGKWTDLGQIEIHPLLLRKGETNVAIFGLSHIHDNRLVRLFLESKVTFEKPRSDGSDWFNLMVLHQNRADRGHKNYLPEDSLPDFMHLVVWGHEHDCKIAPEQNAKGTWISQPGSSVATSLAEGESLEKFCGLLKIYKTTFKIDPIKLKTVRPFIFETVDLDDYAEDLRLNEGDIHEKVLDFCHDKVLEMIRKSKDKISGDNRQPTKPLIRLRVMYYDENQLINTIRFGQQFTDSIANPTDVIKFIKNTGKKPKSAPVKIDKSAMDNAYEQNESRVEDVVDRYFCELSDENQQLDIFPIKLLSEMCRRLVDNDDDNAAEIILEQQFQRACKFLDEKSANEENVEELLHEFRDRKNDANFTEILGLLDNQRPKTTQAQSTYIDSGSDDDIPLAAKGGKQNTSTTGRGRGGRGRATATTRGRGRGAKAAASNNVPATSTLNIKVNTSTTRASKQPTIAQSFTQTQRTSPRTSARKTKSRVVYVSDSDD